MKNNKEEKNMELWVKFLLALAGVGAVGMVAYGIVTYNTTKENEIKEAAASNPTIIQVNDSTSDNNKPDIEQTVDYSLEAETAFSESGLPEECRDQFISVFIDYRKKGIKSEEIVEKLVAKYNEIVNQSVQANGASDDAEIETPEDEEYQRQLELEEAARQQAEETTSEEKAENSLPADTQQSETTSTSDFDVLYLEEQELYAQSSVNIRSGAGINYEKVGSLSLNEAVTVDGLAVTTEGKEWFQLVNSEGSLIGYVSASYLGKEKVQETPAASENKETTQSNKESTTETPSQAPTGDNSLTGAGTTAPSGAKVGRNVTYEQSSGVSQGGSGDFDNVQLH